MSEQRFLDMVGAVNLIPGPNSTELAIQLGYERARWRGLLVAGVCFIAPAFLIVLALAWAYDRYGRTPAAESLLYAVKPVVVAIVVWALVGLLRTAVKGWLTAAIAVGAVTAYLLGVNELAGALRRRAHRDGGAARPRGGGGRRPAARPVARAARRPDRRPAHPRSSCCS